MIERPDREFKVWAYTVGHSQLLLRSTKGPGFASRVDILFKGVRSMRLSSVIHGLVVTIADDELAGRIIHESGMDPDLRARVYLLGPGRDAHVIGRVVFETEDEGDYWDPSALWPGPGGIPR